MELTVDAVSHSYGDVAALDGIDLTVRAGEIVALIGPSGCGKSTLLGIIGGLIAPSSGRVMVHGDPPAGSLNPFTYIFQDFALLPWRTVEGNVALPLEHHAFRQPSALPASTMHSPAPASPTSARPCLASSPAACASASASRARSWSVPRSC